MSDLNNPWPFIVAICLAAFLFSGCTSADLEAWGEVLDTLADEPATRDAKRACFHIEGYTAREACQDRYDRTFSQE